MKTGIQKTTILLLLLISISCRQKTEISKWIPYDETEEIIKSSSHESRKMRFRLIQSKVLDKNAILGKILPQITGFSENDYQKLMPLILEQDIPTLQSYIFSGELNYEKLTQWYLYRIVKYEYNKDNYLNAIIDINPNAVKEARDKDINRSASSHPIYGMPVLLKDNINAEGMTTTAGAVALRKNITGNSYIVERLKEKGAIILGKTNLSEWANFLSSGCPNGYSAVGGQTLNPYGRKIFDTGGSSSGSAVAMAANYAAAAVGTETSGSILSPSGKNSVTGLKPTIGLLSRSGIVPISGTYDTPGPITRNVTDNAILLSAMTGYDNNDPKSLDKPVEINYANELKNGTLKGLRFGVNKAFLKDSLYKNAVAVIVNNGGMAIEYDPEAIIMENFTKVLSADMKKDLHDYLIKNANKEIKFTFVDEIVSFNKEDTLTRIPYGQNLFTGIVADTTDSNELVQLKMKLHDQGVRYFEKPLVEYKLDAILSISNRSAGFAAVAEYPCFTVPMGFMVTGEPSTLTFIARPFEEDKLLKMGYAFEQASKLRKKPAALN